MQTDTQTDMHVCIDILADRRDMRIEWDRLAVEHWLNISSCARSCTISDQHDATFPGQKKAPHQSNGVVLG